jgi:hypothetical protein
MVEASYSQGFACEGRLVEGGWWVRGILIVTELTARRPNSEEAIGAGVLRECRLEVEGPRPRSVFLARLDVPKLKQRLLVEVTPQHQLETGLEGTYRLLKSEELDADVPL